MISDRYKELINGDIDGTISSDEKRELDAYLANHPDARRLYEQLKELPKLLSEVKEVEPPPELKQRILSEVQTGSYRRKHRKAQGFGLNLFGTRFDLRYAYGFAAGLIVGIAIYAIAFVGVTRDGYLDPLDLSGTVLQRGSSEGTRTVSSFAFEVDGADGRLQTDLARDQVVLHLYVSAKRAIEIVLNFDRNQISFQGYRLSSGETGELKLSAGQVRISQEGDNEYHLIFGLLSNLTSDIRFEVYADGLLFERSIDLAGGDR